MGCAVTLTPGATGLPDAGVILTILPPYVTILGMPVATVGSICQMINSLTGAPYNIPIPPLGASTSASVTGRGLVRMGDRYLIGPAVLLILGPPLAPTIIDASPP